MQAVLASLAVLGGSGMLAASDAALSPRATILLAIAAAVGVLAAVLLLALRALARRRAGEQIDPSFETSILAFPPEPRFERRTLTRT
jgi:hypothetical protein